MQLDTADFAPRCRYLANSTKHAILAHSWENMTSSTTLDYTTYRIAVRQGLSQTTTGNMYRKCGEILTYGF